MAFKVLCSRHLLVLAIGLLPPLAGTPVRAAAPPASSAPPPVSRLAEGNRLKDLLGELKWAAAESLALAEIDRVTATPPVDSLGLAEAIAGLVRARIGSGRFRVEGTRALADSAVALRTRGFGPDDPLVAESIASVARLRVAFGDLPGAMADYERALGIRERAYGPEHRLVAQSLNSLGVVASQIGDYAAARGYYERALAIRQKLLGPEHPEVGDTWTNLGYVLGETGDYNGALAARQKSLDIIEKALGPDHPRVSSSLNNLAEGYRAMGDYETAITLHERAVAIDEKAFGGEGPDAALHLSNLAVNVMLSGDPVRARPLFERALALREKMFGPDHREVGATLVNLAEMMRRTGNPGECARLSGRAAAIFEKSGGPGSPDLATALMTRGNAERDLGNWKTAEATCEQALAIRREVFGDAHLHVGEVLREMAVVRLATGDVDSAIAFALRSETILRDHFRLLARGLPERAAIRFAASTPRALDVALAAGLRPRAPGQVEELWNAVIASRALILDEMAARQHAAWRSEAPETAGRRVALQAATREMARLAVQGAGGDGGDGFRLRWTAAREARDRAERELAEASAEYRGEQSRATTTLASIRRALPVGSGLVAYVRFAQPAPGGTEGLQYAAFVLSDREATPRFISIGDSTAVESAVQAWRREAAGGAIRGGAAQAGADGTCFDAGEALRRKVWDPVAALLADRQRIFIVPDGSLHLVNFAALPAPGADRGHFLVDDEPLLHMLTTERDLGGDVTSPAYGNGLLALGGAAFDRESSSSPHVGVPATATFRGATSPCPLFRNVRFAPLPGSLREVEQVRALWRASKESDGNEILLSGAAATEEAVKRLAPGRRVLHLATHGFFIGSDCAGGGGITRGIGGLVAARPSEKPPPRTERAPARDDEAISMPSIPAPPENPLHLSGIALAGANRREIASPSEEDGVLTAEEIASLNLDGVEWAVLSACDTGLGDVSSGEGIFGLRRALQVAGARSVILSLWSIRDRDAVDWMDALYRGRFMERLDTATAVRDACRAVLAERRRHHESTHPFYWAGFLATGDWR